MHYCGNQDITTSLSIYVRYNIILTVSERVDKIILLVPFHFLQQQQ